jgi:hypothetical protein
MTTAKIRTGLTPLSPGFKISIVVFFYRFYSWLALRFPPVLEGPKQAFPFAALLPLPLRAS